MPIFAAASLALVLAPAPTSEVVWVEPVTHRRSRRNPEIRRAGPEGPELEGAEFYEAVNRPDLAAQYRRRDWIRLGVVAPLVAAGVPLLPLGFSRYQKGNVMILEELDNPYTDAERERDRRWLRQGITMMTVGSACLVGATLFGTLFRVHPLSGEQRRELVMSLRSNGRALELQLRF